MLGWLLFLIVGTSFAAAAVYVVWRVLDRQHDVDGLREQLDTIERRLAALESERTRTTS